MAKVTLLGVSVILCLLADVVQAAESGAFPERGVGTRELQCSRR
jgi:hypothetical protein